MSNTDLDLDRLEAIAEHIKQHDFWESGNEILEMVSAARRSSPQPVAVDEQSDIEYHVDLLDGSITVTGTQRPSESADAPLLREALQAMEMALIGYTHQNEVTRAALAKCRAALAQHPSVPVQEQSDKVDEQKEKCLLSWAGKNVYGDRASIKAVKIALHDAGTVEYLKDRLKEAEDDLARQSCPPVQAGAPGEIYREALEHAAFYVRDHCKDGENHADIIAGLKMPAKYAAPIPAHPAQDGEDARDAKRLDWLEAKKATLTRLYNDSGYILAIDGRAISTATKARVGIDAAMAATQQGGSNG